MLFQPMVSQQPGAQHNYYVMHNEVAAGLRHRKIPYARPTFIYFISGARMAKIKQNKREITIWLLQQLLYFISDVRTSTHLK